MTETLELKLVKEKGNLFFGDINADKIGRLLAEKHSKDVFVPECKNGETWGARDLLRLDAWVLLRTYSPLTTIGYEVKVSRSDFENDQKWTGYLDLCHQFYFVCPAGMIRATDLPSAIGLIWVSRTGVLHTKRKAERRMPDVKKLNDLMVYVLMARTQIVANMYETGKTADKYDHLKGIRETVEKANAKKELAYFVKGHVRELYNQTQKASDLLASRERQIKSFEEHLAKLGITWDSTSDNWQDNQQVDNAIDILKQHLDNWTIRRLAETGQSMINTAKALENYYKEKPELKS